MSKSDAIQSPIVSPKIYNLIFSSPQLRDQVLPEGLFVSPYEVLDYKAVLTLNDPHGNEATFSREETVRFLQNGVAAILDHAWGDGVLLTNYSNSVGQLMDSFKDQGCRHLVIGLKRAMAKGETLRFRVERKSAVAFGGDREWVETKVDHPIRRISRVVEGRLLHLVVEAIAVVAGHRLVLHAR